MAKGFTVKAAAPKPKDQEWDNDAIKEDEFEVTWRTLKNMVGIMHTDYEVSDLSYEELMVNRKVSLDSSY